MAHFCACTFVVESCSLPSGALPLQEWHYQVCARGCVPTWVGLWRGVGAWHGVAWCGYVAGLARMTCVCGMRAWYACVACVHEVKCAGWSVRGWSVPCVCESVFCVWGTCVGLRAWEFVVVRAWGGA